MNKKLIAGLIVLLGVVATFAFLNNSEAGVQLVGKKHAVKKHAWGWGSWRKHVNYGCDASDEYTDLCSSKGGVICSGNIIGNDECCETADSCVEKSKSVWGYTKKWHKCASGQQLSLGKCP